MLVFSSPHKTPSKILACTCMLSSASFVSSTYWVSFERLKEARTLILDSLPKLLMVNSSNFARLPSERASPLLCLLRRSSVACSPVLKLFAEMITLGQMFEGV